MVLFLKYNNNVNKKKGSLFLKSKAVIHLLRPITKIGNFSVSSINPD